MAKKSNPFTHLLRELTKNALAKKLGISRQRLQYWIDCQVPDSQVMNVERKLGIRRSVIRPDLYPADRERE